MIKFLYIRCRQLLSVLLVRLDPDHDGGEKDGEEWDPEPNWKTTYHLYVLALHTKENYLSSMDPSLMPGQLLPFCGLQQIFMTV